MNATLNETPMVGQDKVLDVCAVPCAIKHGLIVRTFLELPVGDHFILVNGHDPVPLFYQFSAEWPATFTWEHLVKSPAEVRVKITKIKATNPESTPEHCCPSAK